MKILLGMSGGLDSSYAAHVLKKEGHEVVGAVLKMHRYTETDSAKKAAEEIGIPLVEIDCAERFERDVVEPFCLEYLAARTPNPCIFCNPSVKFGVMCEYAALNGFDRVSTGHYCKIVERDGRYAIARADDGKKDQSYVLWGLRQDQLKMLYFPLFGASKEDVRKDARLIGLSSADAKESQEICFIPDNDYASFIEARYGKMPEGDFISPEGNACGRHRGLLHYTVGQRKGLGIALGRPVFISRIDAAENRIYLADAGGEFTESASVTHLNFQLCAPFEGEIEAFAKMRYAATPARSRIKIENGRAEVRFDSPSRAVTPGQSAVFYDDNGAILFGGLIV